MPADHCRNFMQAGCYRLNGSAPSWPSPTWVGSHFFFLPMSRRSPFLLTVEAAAGAGIVVDISPRRFGEEAAELVARANIPALLAAIATMAINWNMAVCLAFAGKPYALAKRFLLYAHALHLWPMHSGDAPLHDAREFLAVRLRAERFAVDLLQGPHHPAAYKNQRITASNLGELAV
jgi:hypothetical protein